MKTTGAQRTSRISPPRILAASLTIAAAAASLECSSNGTDAASPDASPAPPPMTHGPPNEAAGQMCVVCHTCGTDGTTTTPAQIIDRTHAVCNSCHNPDGSVKVHGTDGGCEWEMDCEANPPIVNCNDCHTVEYVNDLCEACH